MLSIAVAAQPEESFCTDYCFSQQNQTRDLGFADKYKRSLSLFQTRRDV